PGDGEMLGKTQQYMDRLTVEVRCAAQADDNGSAIGPRGQFQRRLELAHVGQVEVAGHLHYRTPIYVKYVKAPLVAHRCFPGGCLTAPASADPTGFRTGLWSQCLNSSLSRAEKEETSAACGRRKLLVPTRNNVMCALAFA